MAFWSRFPLSAKQSRAPRSGAQRQSWLAFWDVNAPRHTKRSYETLARDGYVSNPVVRRAVQMICDSLASAPIIVSQHDMRLDSNHPLVRMLSMPNPTSSGSHFREALASYLLLHGNAFVEMVEGADGLPEELYALRPERINIVPGASGWPAHYTYGVDGQAVRFEVDSLTGRSDLLHLKNFHPLDDHYGSGLLDAAESAIESHNAAARWALALLENAARPSGALTFEGSDGSGNLTSEQFTRLKAEMAEHFSGSTNAGRPLLLEGGLKWQPLSLSPADMDFINGKHASARDIALAFGVPPMLLGIPGDATYANYQEANRALWRLTILPLARKIFDGLAHWLEPFWDHLHISIDLDNVPALAADRERLWKQVVGADFLTEDERRSLLGLQCQRES
jgi:HK97 family phage portal protein